MSNKLTGKERDEWSSILINKAIKKIHELEKANPYLKDLLPARAKAEAIKQLGMQVVLLDLQDDIAALTDDIQELESRFNSKIADLGMTGHYWADQEVGRGESLFQRKLEVIDQAIDNKSAEILQDLMAADPVGAQILELREAATGGIRAAVLLSTSSDALKKLWDSFTDKLGLTTSELEKAAAKPAA